MKKIFLMLAAAGMLFSSCQKDENLGGSAGETLVTVTASVPQAVGTRAAMNSTSDKGGVVNVDDSKYDLRFILRIYEGEKVVKEETWAGSTKTLEYQKQYRLVPGHNYKFVVWADFVKEGTTADLYYSTSDFAAVSELEIPEGETRINNEARDAYFVAQDENNLAENASVSLTLKRPFGKVRVVTTDWAEEAIQNATVPEKVTITYNNTTLYTGMNLLTGELSGSNATMEYTADINDYTNEGEGSAEKTLYVDYLWGKTISNPDTATASTVEQYAIHFTIDAGIRTYDVKTNVPISRNWLTTVKGNILTTNTVININVDPEFDGFYGDTLLQLAAISGGEVTLTENVVLTEPLTISANMTINLNGKTLTGSVVVAEGASLTAEGGKMVNTNDAVSAITSNGNLTLNDVEVSSARHALRIESGKAVINGGTYTVAPTSAKTLHAVNVGDDGKEAQVTIKGGTFTGPKGTIADSGSAVAVKSGSTVTIEGGDFSRGKNSTISNKGTLSITGGTFDQDPTTYVAEGYKATETEAGKCWAVAKADVTPVTTADGLIAALENGEDVVLYEDVKINPAGMSNAYGTTGINVKNGQTIDGGGNTLDIKGAGGTWDSGINTTGGLIKNITVTGSFRGIFINHNSDHSEPVVLDNVIIDGTTYTISCDQGKNQNLIATNSTFNGWTSYAATIGTVSFTDCSFGEGNGYAYCRPYAPTTFTNCKFEKGYEVGPVATVTFENCTLDGVALTADNLATLVTSNIANATVK